jgi:hypothetical protein
LAGIPGVRNAATFVTAASLANEESVALFMRVRSQLIALYSSKVKAVASFVEANRAPLVKTKDGTIVGIFPLDYVAWTPALAAKERAISEDIRKMTGVKGKELWITGTVDPVAKGALENRGWKIHDRVLDRLLK